MGSNRMMDARYAEFAALRDRGESWQGARTALGISDSTARRYDRAYRLARGITRPPKPVRWVR